jgi:two-component system, NtrC family, response regulator PilR
MPKVVSNAAHEKVPRVIKTPSVLVVDDEPDMIETFREVILAGIDCKLLVARSVAEARKVLGKNPVDVMVADVMLPDGSGLDLLPDLRLTSPDAAAAFMTGDPSIDHTVHALRHGAVDYIIKPFTASHVTERLRHVIQQ